MTTCLMSTSKAYFLATQAIAQHLKETGRLEKIINISSSCTELMFPHFTSYCASKGGMKWTALKLSRAVVRITVLYT